MSRQWAIVLLAATFGFALQVPLQAPIDQTLASESRNASRWRFDAPLSSTNTTSNLIFDGVSSLLQQWGNTRYRNGHNIVPVTIPVGTIFYHGTTQKVVPTTPEWVATDPEHAYPFCQVAEGEKGCWSLTVAAARPLNILYFDGASAAKLYGPLDTQDLIAFGEVIDNPERAFEEYTRIERLCSWGKKYNLDGFMRMGVDFELMICDFQSSFEVVSFVKLVPGFPPPPAVLKKPSLAAFRMLEAGQMHNHFPGETRAQLDLTRLVSLYDTELFPSLVKGREGQERWFHRAAGIGKDDRERLMQHLDDVLSAKPSRSNIDWTSIYRVVIHRYADRLEVLQSMFQSKPPASEIVGRAKKTVDVFEYVESMLYPYILYGVEPPSSTAHQNGGSHDWAIPVFERCATLNTAFISSKVTLSSSEKLLLRAVNDVLYEICRALVGIWAEGREIGYGGNPEIEERRNSLTDHGTLGKWENEVDKLISWLDWSVMIKCRPTCGFEVRDPICFAPRAHFFTGDVLPPYLAFLAS
ncbi:hypothetical protein CC2G_007036 [Coprinopsis cinerea AmutBmut pab1-1]|nr:hypothetical protein CC2G_007036 [Coprinopsis cinerea AmutBmut pab1-1]